MRSRRAGIRLGRALFDESGVGRGPPARPRPGDRSAVHGAIPWQLSQSDLVRALDRAVEHSRGSIARRRGAAAECRHAGPRSANGNSIHQSLLHAMTVNSSVTFDPATYGFAADRLDAFLRS